MKKISFIVMVVFLLGVFGLTACNNDTLDVYKTAGKADIETYAQERKDNYCEDNWTVVCGIVETGKQEVGEAKSKEGVDAAISEAKTAINAVEEREVVSELVKNGAYFAVGNNGNYAIVKGNSITISNTIAPSQINAVNIVSDTFDFALVDGSYIGKNVRKSISFKVLGDELRIQVAWHGANAIKTIFKKNDAIAVSSENPIQLNAPQDISINSTRLRLRPEDFLGKPEAASILLNGMGILGVGVEIKQSGKDDFEVMVIRDFYSEPDCFFDVYFPDLSLTQGLNIVRVRYLGGLFLQNDEIKVSENSVPIYFSITVDAEGKFITERI